MEYTNTSLGTWNRCKFLYDKIFNDMIDKYAEPIRNEDSEALSFGYVLHKCLEAIYNNTDYNTVLKLYQDDPLTDEDNEFTAKLRGLIEGGIKCKKELGINSDIKYLEKELVLSMPIAADDIYAGKIDGIVEMNGVRYILDHKSYSRGTSSRFDKFHYSPQLIMYMTLAKHNGYDVQGYLIDNWRVPALRKKVKETYSEFKDRIVYDIFEITERQVKDSLKATDTVYFTLHAYHPTKDEVDSVYTTEYNKIQEIRQTLVFDQNFHNCHNGYGFCDLWGLCHTDEYDESQLKKREHLHPELTIL